MICDRCDGQIESNDGFARTPEYDPLCVVCCREVDDMIEVDAIHYTV